MTVLASHARPGTPEFEANETEHRRLAADLSERLERVAAGGGERARERHVARGKLLPRERVERLCDPGAPFLELSPLAAEDLYDGDAPARGSSPASGACPVARSWWWPTTRRSRAAPTTR